MSGCDDRTILETPVEQAVILRRSPVYDVCSNIKNLVDGADFGTPGRGGRLMASEILKWYTPNINFEPAAEMCLQFARDVLSPLPSSIGGDIPSWIIRQWLADFSAHTLPSSYLDTISAAVRSRLPVSANETWLLLEEHYASASTFRKACASSVEETGLLVWSCAGGGLSEIRIAISLAIKTDPSQLWPLNPEAWNCHEGRFGVGSAPAASLWRF